MSNDDSQVHDQGGDEAALEQDAAAQPRAPGGHAPTDAAPPSEVPGAPGEPAPEGLGAAAPGAPTWYGPSSAASPGEAHGDRGRFGRLLRNATVAWVVVGVLLLAVGGLAAALATTGTQSPARATRPFAGAGPGPGFGRGPGSGGPGRFGGTGAGRGVVGTVASVGSGSFTVTTQSGQTVTVQEQSSTTYDSGTASASASAVTQGAHVLVQGSRSSNTVTATRVVVLPAGSFGPGFSSPR